MTTDTTRQSQYRARLDLLMTVLLGLLLIGGLLGAVRTYLSLRAFVAQTQLPIFPSTDIATAAPAQPPSAADNPPLSVEPVQPVESGEAVEGSREPAVPNSGVTRDVPVENVVSPPVATERLTVLIMGIDRRPGETGPWRTDSMILVSIDPATNAVDMLSVPRDLYVTIPDYGYGEHLDRINTAYFHGDASDYPGGGAALAKQTIRRNFGLEVDRYIVLDFDGFRHIIDYIGGVTLDVPDLLVDREYPTENYGIMTVRFEPGVQTMDGERALIYSRTRKSTSDFARAARQQDVIIAVRDKVLSLDIIPSLTPANLARIVATLDDSLMSDLSLDEVLAFAQVARRVQDDNIQRVVIDSTLVREFFTDQGAQVLQPRWDKILPLTKETFGVELLAIGPLPPAPPPRPTPASAGTSTTWDEIARIAVHNGTDQEDAEMVAANELQRRGFNVTSTGKADRNDYRETMILLYNEKTAQTAEALQEYYNLSPGRVQLMSREGTGVDIVVILGEDALTASSEGAARP